MTTAALFCAYSTYLLHRGANLSNQQLRFFVTSQGSAGQGFATQALSKADTNTKTNGQPFGYATGDIFGAGAEVIPLASTNELEILSKSLDVAPPAPLDLEPFLSASWSFYLTQVIIDGGGLGHLLDGRTVGRVFYPKPLLRTDGSSMAVLVAFPSSCPPLSCTVKLRFSLYLSTKYEVTI